MDKFVATAINTHMLNGRASIVTEEDQITGAANRFWLQLALSQA